MYILRMKKFMILVLCIVFVGGVAYFSLRSKAPSRNEVQVSGEHELPDWVDLKRYQNNEHHFSIEYPAAYKDVRETPEGVSFAVGKTWPWEYAVTVTSTNALTTLKWYVTQDRVMSPGSTPKEGQINSVKLIGMEDHEFFVYDIWRMVSYGDDTFPSLVQYTAVAVVDKGRLFTFSYHYPSKYGQDIDPNLEKLVKSFHFID